jgi:hypothetical protein
VLKRLNLWNVGKEPLPFKNEQFSQFIRFIENTTEFLQIRETPELFANMNEFYNLILKFQYLVSLSHRGPLLAHQVEHIANFKNGRVNGLRPSKIK